MVDSIGGWNILHLCSETNNGQAAIKIVKAILKDGERGV